MHSDRPNAPFGGGSQLNIGFSPALAARKHSESVGRFALPTFVVLAVLAVALIVLPATANAVVVKNLTYKNNPEPGSSLSGLQASGHGGATVSFERGGTETEDIKSVRLDLPPGVFANPESAQPKCTDAQFKADNCPVASNVGSVDVTVKAASLLDLDIHGTIDILVPEAGQTATLGLSLRPDKICILFVFCAVPEKIFLKTGIQVKTYQDQGLTTVTDNSPSTATVGIPIVVATPTLSLPITINKMSLTFQSRSGVSTTSETCTGWSIFKKCTTTTHPPSGPYFFRQSGSCMPATVYVAVTTVQNNVASQTTSYTPTGCDDVPFDPTIAFTPTNTDSNVGTPVKFDLTIPEADAAIQHALPKIVDADFPDGSGLDLNALSGVDNCTEAQLLARACPASSIIGNAQAFSKYLPGANASTPGLVGNVYAMSISTQIDIAVELIGPRNTVVLFRGVMGARGNNAYALFDRIPQLPFASFSLTLTTPVYKNPATCGTATTDASVIGFNGGAPDGLGTTVDRSSSYTVDNCPLPPETTINTSPSNPSGDVTPTFTFSSDQPTATFQCSIDNGPWIPCASPYTLDPQAQGTRNFQVKALNSTVEDLTPASRTWNIETTFQITPTITPSTTQAVDHPNVEADFDITGGQPKSIALKLPRGFAASLAGTKCLSAVAAAGGCTSGSEIGSASLTVTYFDGLTDVTETKSGPVFLTDGPTGADAGGIATKIEFDIGTFIATGGAFLVNNGQNQYLELRNIPSQISGIDINASRLEVDLDGSDGFLTNPSNCLLSDWDASGTDQNDNDAAAFNVPFQATGCDTVPFAPTLTQSLANPVANQVTGVTANLTLPAGHAAIKSLQVDEPRVLKPNFPSFGEPSDQCSAAAAPDEESIFDPTSCPTQAIVGSMQIDTPLLSTPLVGTVYLIQKSPIPWLGVKFDQPGISVSLVGVTSTPKVNPSCNPILTPGGCPTRISILFNNVPDVPVTGIDLNLNGPDRVGTSSILSGKILQVASSGDVACVPNSAAASYFTPHSDEDAVLTQSQNIAISGC